MAQRPGWLSGLGGACLLCASVLPVLPALTLRAEEARDLPSFAVAVEAVSLNLAVTDPRGRPVPRLDASDFSLLEDGVPQAITMFTQEEWPIRLSILLDSSGSMADALPVAKRASARLVRTLHAGDEAEVAQFNRRLQLLHEATADQDALVQAIDRVLPSGDTALYNALYVTSRTSCGRGPTTCLAARSSCSRTARTRCRW